MAREWRALRAAQNEQHDWVAVEELKQGQERLADPLQEQRAAWVVWPFLTKSMRSSKM